MKASLALAQEQVTRGKYHDALTTLGKAVSRNKHEARSYPLELADLYRSMARVEAHLGLDNLYGSATWQAYRTIKAGLPNDKDRQFDPLMEVAEMLAETQGQDVSRTFYDEIAGRARHAGRPDIAATAELLSLIRHYPPSEDRDRRIEKIAYSTDPALRGPALNAKLALARIAFESGDVAKGNAIVHEFAALPIKDPILIYEPHVEFSAKELEQSPFRTERYVAATRSTPQGTSYAAFSTTRRIPDNFDDEWIDVSFRVTPDGTVADAKVTNKRGDSSWAKPLLAAITARRYTPGHLNDPHSQRLERYTYTSGYQEATGSHMLQHSPQARIEYFDLSSGSSTTGR